MSRATPNNDYKRVHPLSEGIDNVAPIEGYDWRDEKTYKYKGGADYISWLAWEALRRNVFFQRFCEERDHAQPGSHAEIHSLYKWGLDEFKDYREGISKDSREKPPAWIVTKPMRIVDRASFWPEPYSDWRPGAGCVEEILVDDGEVAVVFDLKRMMCRRSILDQQLEDATKAIKVLFEAYISSEYVKNDVAIPQEGSVIGLLRVADAMLDKSKPTRKDIAEIVFPEFYRKSNPEAARLAAEKCDAKIHTAALKDMSKKIKSAADLIYRGGHAGLLTKVGG